MLTVGGDLDERDIFRGGGLDASGDERQKLGGGTRAHHNARCYMRNICGEMSSKRRIITATLVEMYMAAAMKDNVTLADKETRAQDVDSRLLVE